MGGFGDHFRALRLRLQPSRRRGPWRKNPPALQTRRVSARPIPGGFSSHQARLQLEDRTPVSPSHPFQPFGPGPYRSPGWPPGPGTGGCGGTRRRPAGSSGAGARALAPALAPAPAPGPARAQALMWDMEAGWALVLSAGHGATKHRDGGPSLPGSRTALKRNRIQEQDHGGGGWAGGCGPPHKASSHDKGIQPHHPRSQHLVTAAQRDLWGKKERFLV